MSWLRPKPSNPPTLPEYNAWRVTDTEKVQAVHERRLDDHDRVIGKLEEHLGNLLHRFDSLERKLLVVAGAFFVSSGQADNVLKLLGIAS